MPIPFRKASQQDPDIRCAYLEFVETDKTVYGGLLITDGSGLPKEFVYNEIKVPTGVLWPTETLRRTAASSLAHSLFDACKENATLLVASVRLRQNGFDPAGFTVTLPFALVDGDLIEWIGLEPGAGHAASRLLQDLLKKKLMEESLSRIVTALAEVYGLPEK